MKISHPSQLNLAIPLYVGTVSISQWMVLLCGLVVKAGIGLSLVAGKTV